MLKGVKVEVGVGPHNSKSDESSIGFDFNPSWFPSFATFLGLLIWPYRIVVELVEPLWHIQPSNPTIKLWKLTFSCPNKRWRPRRGERMKGIYMEIQSKWWVISIRHSVIKYEWYLEFESLAEKAWEDACETDDASTERVITGVHFIGELFIGKNLRKILQSVYHP